MTSLGINEKCCFFSGFPLEKFYILMDDGGGGWEDEERREDTFGSMCVFYM